MSDRFANFIDSPTTVPQQVWLVARVVVLAGLVGVIVGALVVPADTLTLFWGLLVPVLPAVWMLAPGLWRNTCPLATANQLPRLFGFSQARTTPAWFHTFAFSIGAGAFIILVLTRKVVFNTSGVGLAVVLSSVVILAFLGGFLFKGKSGWCSSICPLLPIQRLYGQAPVQRIANAHCDPCVGCATNCFDFNPGVAYIADMYDADERFVGQRQLFAGAFPGLVLAFFTVGISDDIGVAAMYGRSAVWILGSLAVFRLCDLYLPARENGLPPIFAGTGFGLFYWYSFPRMAAVLESLIGGDWQLLIWPGRVLAILIAANFVRMAFSAETEYISETAVALTAAKANVPSAILTVIEGPASVKFVGNDKVYPAKNSPSILDIVEAAGLAIESGCRMGVCGADPVAVVSGRGGLSEPLPAEISTLTRLGLGPPNRMACVARVTAPCTIALTPDTSSVPHVGEPTFEPDPSVKRVVVIGNGIAGITAADYVRRNHPNCSIDVISLEPHNLYNRMSISKLIYTAKGTSSLNLLGDEWYERNRIEAWLNTTVRYIDTAAKRIDLGTKESLNYDRLILATGSSPRITPNDGFDRPGCFRIRSSEHAVRIRSFMQRYDCRTAFVAGGGLLGLEAAYSLHRLGLEVTVGERSGRLLHRQLDERGSQILQGFFEHIGMTVRTNVETARIDGDTRTRAVVTTDDETIPAEIFVAAAGINPNRALADAAGLQMGRGVLVDEHMRTSDPNIFAVGDVAEFEGQIWGLWAVAVAQAEVAGKNVAGGDERYRSDIPTTVLKGAGIDMTSFGSIEPSQPGDEVQVIADSVGPFVYAKVVRRGDHVVGGIFINRPKEAIAVQNLYAKYLRASSRPEPVLAPTPAAGAGGVIEF